MKMPSKIALAFSAATSCCPFMACNVPLFQVPSPGLLSPVHWMVSEELCIFSIKSDIGLVSPTCLYPFEYCIFGSHYPTQFCIISKSKKHFTTVSSETLTKREAREAPKTGCLFQMGNQGEAPEDSGVSNAFCLMASAHLIG